MTSVSAAGSFAMGAAVPEWALVVSLLVAFWAGWAALWLATVRAAQRFEEEVLMRLTSNDGLNEKE